jgi:predicted nucleic acid-binding protein
MIVIDTTVLVYAKGAAHPLRDSCRELVSAIADGRVAATTTVEVIQEFAHVRARRRGQADAASLANDFVELLTPLLAVTAADLRTGLALFQRVETLGAFDAVLAAAALGSPATLVSADTAFAGIAGLTHVIPDANGIRNLLGTHV